MRAKLGGGAFPASCAQMNASSSTIFGAIPSFENGSIFTLDIGNDLHLPLLRLMWRSFVENRSMPIIL
jgi:hypothetical protein